MRNADLDQAEVLARRERESGIRAASAAISGGGFTHCIDCGIPIDPARRHALPSVKRCFDCQQTYELDQVMM